MIAIPIENVSALYKQNNKKHLNNARAWRNHTTPVFAKAIELQNKDSQDTTLL